MALGLVSERPSGAACSACQSRPEGLWRAGRVVAECVAAILVASVSLAYASPPDPSWIPGIYDDHDSDDVVGMWTDATAVSDSQGWRRVECVFMELVLRAATGWVPSLAIHRQAIRGPPIERRDASVGLLLIFPAPASQLSNVPSVYPQHSSGIGWSFCSCASPPPPWGYDSCPCQGPGSA
jgi:hypothetical protein